VSVIEPAFVKTAIATTARSRAESHPAALLAASRAVYPWVRDMAGEVEFGVEDGTPALIDNRVPRVFSGRYVPRNRRGEVGVVTLEVGHRLPVRTSSAR
jgi:hypothetical protein